MMRLLLVGSIDKSWQLEQTAAATGTGQGATGAATMTEIVNKQEPGSPLSSSDPLLAPSGPFWLNY